MDEDNGDDADDKFVSCFLSLFRTGVEDRLCFRGVGNLNLFRRTVPLLPAAAEPIIGERGGGARNCRRIGVNIDVDAVEVVFLLLFSSSSLVVVCVGVDCVDDTTDCD